LEKKSKKLKFKKIHISYKVQIQNLLELFMLAKKNVNEIAEEENEKREKILARPSISAWGVWRVLRADQGDISDRWFGKPTSRRQAGRINVVSEARLRPWALHIQEVGKGYMERGLKSSTT
jgi:hypothetical protein